MQMPAIFHLKQIIRIIFLSFIAYEHYYQTNPQTDGKNPDERTGGSNDPTRTTTTIQNLHTNDKRSCFSFFRSVRSWKSNDVSLFAETVVLKYERSNIANSLRKKW